MKNWIFPALFAAVVWGVIAIVTAARADQNYLPSGLSQNLSRPCDLESITLQNVTTTDTSARTSNAVGIGTVRVICTQDAYVAVGTVGPTATTGSILIPGFTPEYFYSAGGSKFAFIRDTTSGTCQVTECK